MSSFYLDILKDRLYTFGANSKERRAAQWVLNQILSTMTRLMAPALSFTAEEVWQSMNGGEFKSVFLSPMPKADEAFLDDALEAKWTKLIAVRNEVNKALELKRKDKTIGNSLAAKVTLHIADTELQTLMEGYSEELPTLFIVSEATITSEGEGEFKAEEVEGLSITAQAATAQKCERCWNRRTSVGTIGDAPDICSRCHSAINE